MFQHHTSRHRTVSPKGIVFLFLIIFVSGALQACGGLVTPPPLPISPTPVEGLALIPASGFDNGVIPPEAVIIAPLEDLTTRASGKALTNFDFGFSAAESETPLTGFTLRSSLSEVPDSAMVLLDRNLMPGKTPIAGDFRLDASSALLDGEIRIVAPQYMQVSKRPSGGLEIIASSAMTAVLSGTNVISLTVGTQPAFSFNLTGRPDADIIDIIEACKKKGIVDCVCKHTPACEENPPN